MHNLLNHLPFLPKRMKIEKVNKLVANLHDKTEYATRIRSLKETLSHCLVFKTLPRIIEFKQKTWLKSYIDMN